MEDIYAVLSNRTNARKFVDYMWVKYCKTYFGNSCLDSQKAHIQKYRLSIPANTSIDQLIRDLSNFAQSRGSSLAAEFEAWIRGLSDIEYRMVLVGGKRGTRGTRGTRRKHKHRKTRKMRN
jgi:hypothetical protein